MPALVLRKELVIDSGGAGKFRGGLGQLPAGNSRETKIRQIGIFPNGIHSEVEGFFGGKSGGIHEE